VSWVRGAGELSEAMSTREITGSAGFGRFCANPDGGRLYFAARLDRGADRVGLADPEAAPGELMALWTFDQAPRVPVTMWVGLSWVSIEEARANLDAEQLPFEEARDAAALSWQRELSRIEVSGGSGADRSRFYTALYHALIHPSILQDVSGTYPKFSIHEVGLVRDGARYTVFSLWDTYRTLHPLLTLIYPEKQAEILKSLEDMVIAAGEPPKWELIGDEVQMMVGDPAAVVFADSYAKGLTDFDAHTVYPILRSSADRPAHRPAVDEYLDLGFVSMESATTIWGPVSTTLEYALSDWSLAELARMLGFDEEVAPLLERARSYTGFYDEQTDTLRPRNRDGSFLEPFDPDAIEGSLSFRLGGPGYVEGTAWHYAFFVPHDVDGLIVLRGQQAFVDRLQWIFDTDRFVIWNEPDMGYPYLFTFVEGEEQRTQRTVRSVMERYFGTGPAGLPGNDDAGTLSAWFVFSAMGFYPVTPGLAEYRLGSPLFEKVTIHLSESHHEGETFVIEALGNGAQNVFITEAHLNGRPLEGAVLAHGAITRGGELRLRMSATPN
jgi:predicted alpha-1,2-mannosidase